MKTITYDETLWKLVPVALTGAMLEVLDDSDLNSRLPQQIWDYLLAAAPSLNGDKESA